MKRNFIPKQILASLLISVLFIVACKKKDDKNETPVVNRAPNCSIVNPSNGDQISKGELLTIEIEASDDDGEVEKVEVFIDGNIVDTLESTPYATQWNTTDYSEGNHTIKAVAYDNQRKTKEAEISVNVSLGSLMLEGYVIPGNFLNSSGATIYTVSDSAGDYMGYMFGTNGYQDVAKAEKFTLGDNSYALSGGMFWVGYKHKAGNSAVQFKLWDMDGNTGVTTQGENQVCPNTELASKSVLISNVDTSYNLDNAHVAMFDSPIQIHSDYAMGIDMTNLYETKDSIALVTTNDGEGNNLELTWEKWSDQYGGTWATLNSVYSVDLDLMIFPILASESAKVGGGNFVFGMKLSKAQRNFSRNLHQIDYEVESYSSNVMLEIYDLTGNRIVSKDLGAKEAGSYSTFIAKNVLCSGKYVYVLQSNGNKLAKELIIQ